MSSAQRIQELVRKKRSAELTPEEEQELQRLLSSGEAYPFSSAEEKEATKQRMRSRIFAEIETESTETNTKRSIHFLYRYAVAACLILLCGLGYLFFINKQKQIITVSSSGSVIRHALPDGSTIWLNKQSEVVYANNFSKERRLTIIKGSVFFSVKKDVSHPFTVASNNIHTTVKGTSFSVSIQPQTKDIKVSVATGRVAVSQAADTLKILMPHERLRFAAETKHVVADSVSIAEVNGWISGDIVLERASLSDLAAFLQTNYDVNVINKINTNTRQYYVHLSSKTGLHDAVAILNLIVKKEGVKLMIQNNTVTIQSL